MFVTWEIKDGQPRILTVTPLRTGEVYYKILWSWAPYLNYYRELYYDDAGLEAIWQARLAGRGYHDNEVKFTPDRCSYVDAGVKLVWLSWDILYLIMLPIHWEGMSKPDLFISRADTGNNWSRKNMGGVFGRVPSLSRVADIPADLYVRPGKRAQVSTLVSVQNSGGTVEFTLQDPKGVVTTSVDALNIGESAKYSLDSEMPALLPGETQNFQTSAAFQFCDWPSNVRTREALDEIKQAMSAYWDQLSRKLTTNTTLHPTDAFLVDTKKGIYELLGKDLSVTVRLVRKDKPPQQFKLTAPARLEVPPDRLAYMKLDFSRSIAVCEDRNLVSEDTTSYERSKLPFNFARSLATSLKPALPGEGLPLPRFLRTRSKVDSQVV